jgi:CBS domain-containing protein
MQEEPMTIQELMTTHPQLAHAYDTLDVAAQKMWDNDVGAIPIVDDQDRLSGIVTDRDICMAAYTQGRTLRDIIIGEVMSQHPIACHARDRAADVVNLMKAHQIHRIPVIDDEGHVVGIVSVNDFIRTGTAVPSAALVSTLASIGRDRRSNDRAAARSAS